MQAAERVRRARGFALIVERGQAPAKTEDVTVAVERELARPSAGQRPSTEAPNCAAAINMAQALKRVTHEYAKQHVLDANPIDPKRTAAIFELVLRIERDAIRHERGYAVIADSNHTLAAAPSVRDLTLQVVARLLVRFVSTDPARVLAQLPERTTASDPCSELVAQSCGHNPSDPDACDAALQAATRISPALCEIASLPIELVAWAEARVLSSDSARAAELAFVHSQDCRGLLTRLCGDRRTEFADCKNAAIAIRQLSPEGCALRLRQLEPANEPPDAGDSTAAPIPTNPF